MYYHIIIEIKEKESKSGKFIRYVEFDRTNVAEIEEKIIIPFLKKGEFQFKGYFLNSTEIRRIEVKQTSQTAEQTQAHAQARIAPNVFAFVTRESVIEGDRYTTDITTEVFDRVRKSLTSDRGPPPSTATPDLSKIFIVHGRDNLSKTEVARFIEKFGFEAIILHEQPSAGKTIIEKIEANTAVGFAVVLYTPCDAGGIASHTSTKPRARQNVVFEHGYLLAKLGRHNVSALVKGEVEIPNDISGVVYVPLDDRGAWHLALAKELRAAGYLVDMNKL